MWSSTDSSGYSKGMCVLESERLGQGESLVKSPLGGKVLGRTCGLDDQWH